MQSFSDFVKVNKNNPNRSIIAEAVSDNDWNDLISLLESKSGKIISVTNAYMHDGIKVNKDGNDLIITGDSIFSLRRERIVEIDSSINGQIRVKDKDGWWNTIVYLKQN